MMTVTAIKFFVVFMHSPPVTDIFQ